MKGGLFTFLFLKLFVIQAKERSPKQGVHNGLRQSTVFDDSSTIRKAWRMATNKKTISVFHPTIKWFEQILVTNIQKQLFAGRKSTQVIPISVLSEKGNKTSDMESAGLSSSSFSIDNILKPDKCDSSQEPRSADRALTLAERLAGKYCLMLYMHGHPISRIFIVTDRTEKRVL